MGAPFGHYRKTGTGGESLKSRSPQSYRVVPKWGSGGRGRQFVIELNCEWVNRLKTQAVSLGRHHARRASNGPFKGLAGVTWRYAV